MANESGPQMDIGRGMGTTTAQMQQAPRNAIYVWPHRGSLDYAVALARHLGRDDLQIHTAGTVFAEGHLRARRTRLVYVIDHGAALSKEHRSNLAKHLEHCALVDSNGKA